MTKQCEYCAHLYPGMIESSDEGDIDVCGCCYARNLGDPEWEAELRAQCIKRGYTPNEE